MPSTPLGVLVLLSAAAPGWVFTLILRRRRWRSKQTAIQETVELVVVGSLSTLLAAAVVTFFYHACGWIPDLDTQRLMEAPTSYVFTDPVAARLLALAFVIVLALSFALAWLFAIAVTKLGNQSRQKYHPDQDAKFLATGHWLGRYQVYISAEMKETGDRLKGWLQFASDPFEEDAAVVLAGRKQVDRLIDSKSVDRSVRYQTEELTDRTHLLLVPFAEIRYLTARLYSLDGTELADDDVLWPRSS